MLELGQQHGRWIRAQLTPFGCEQSKHSHSQLTCETALTCFGLHMLDKHVPREACFLFGFCSTELRTHAERLGHNILCQILSKVKGTVACPKRRVESVRAKVLAWVPLAECPTPPTTTPRVAR